MNRYNPNRAPVPAKWLALDEQVRIGLAETFHREAKVKLPNRHIHAVFHAIIENQIAENLPSVVQAMARLTAEGLTRHDALHAIGSVLVHYLSELHQGDSPGATGHGDYNSAIDQLTAASWLAKD